MGLAEDRAALLAAAEKLEEAAGIINGAGELLDEAEGLAASAIQGYDNHELLEAAGTIVQVNMETSENAIAAMSAATKIRDYVARIS